MIVARASDRPRSSREKRGRECVLVGLLTAELGCLAFSSVRSVAGTTNNGKRGENTFQRSITAAGPFRIHTGFPVRRPRQAAEPATRTRAFKLSGRTTPVKYEPQRSQDCLILAPARPHRPPHGIFSPVGEGGRTPDEAACRTALGSLSGTEVHSVVSSLTKRSAL